MIEVEGLTKRFGSTLAVDDLSFRVQPGVVTGFLVTQATLIALAGRAGDLYGRRRVFIAGVLVLCAGSVLCALAPDAPTLVACRTDGLMATVQVESAYAGLVAVSRARAGQPEG